MASPFERILSSKTSVQERFRKLYRTLYNYFLMEDFVHIKDFEVTLKKLNARIDAVEASSVTRDGAISGGVTTLSKAIEKHTHNVPQAPAGTTVSLPPNQASPPESKVPAPPGGLVEHEEVFLQQRGKNLLAEGPAKSPLGEGLSSEAMTASVQATTDIGA